ncbi:MAG: radical SAM family heme chaperone HemW [Candidatus Paceibacterota bacterium]
MFSIYIHIPFCSYKCPYCDFNTYALTRIPEAQYLKALLREIELGLSSERVKNQKLTSIYFGGGTPGIFSGKAIRAVLDLIRKYTSFNSDLEVTIEANPKEIEVVQLQDYFQAGVNRLSLGAQSLNNQTLLALGRKHQSSDVYHAVQTAQQVGFKNISLDLMFAAPNQSLLELEQDVSDYLAIGVPHISCYELTIEKGTPFYTAQERGNLKIANEDQKLEMYQLIRVRLKEAGYHHYEISNFGIAGRE